MNLLLHGNIRISRVARLGAMVLALVCVTLLSGAEATGRSVVKSVKVKPDRFQITPQSQGIGTKIALYRVPLKYSIPYGIIADASDKIWFTLTAGNSIGVLEPKTGIMKIYRIPSTKVLPKTDWKYDPHNRKAPKNSYTNTDVGSPGNLTIDRDGNLWFVMQLGNSVVRFNPNKEEFTEFIIPVANVQPYDLAVDSKNRVWVVEKNSSTISYIDQTTNKMYAIKLKSGSNLMGIAIDDKDNIWVANVVGNYIGRYNPKTKKFLENPITTPNAQPGRMIFDKSGKLWFCAVHSQQLGVLFPKKGIFGMVDTPGYNSVPQAVLEGSDGKIWYLDSMGGQIGYFNQVKMTWKIISIPVPDSQPMNMTIDSNQQVWFTLSDREANSIAKMPPTIGTSAGDKGGDAGKKGG